MKHMERVFNVRDEFHLTIIIKFYSDETSMAMIALKENV